ncbi:hypothetical protein [Neobacillus mesonae]|uniref:hypothetical protein n=1 Tax=Neobacillus mesonae TaxID=1193713 RepID=UPI00203DF6EC|nr:hypothetical protein [Neobacillus mesonae]MCM3571419.1 hypothetical protein [Neobacillus mesonae]
MEEIQYAFIDEFGDYSFDFDKQNVSTHFIIVAILVKESNIEFLEREMERISLQYFQKELPVTEEDMLQILNEVKDFPFSIYAYAADKRKIREESGVMHQKPFIRYVNRMLYDDLNRTFEQLDLVANIKESKPLLREFQEYVKTKSIPDLFNYSIFGFNQTESKLLLQLSSIIAGILAKGYDRPYFSNQYRYLYRSMKHKIAAINILPPDYKHFLYDYKSDHHDSQYDEAIIKQAVNQVYHYIKKHHKSEEDEERLRIDLLKFLLFNLKENPDEYVYTQEILDNLNALRDIKINQHYFRSNIVSKLRDSGLLIASSNKGYKLPVRLNDLYDFVDLSSLTIYPMIQRISKCRDQILLATNNEVDILEEKEYGYLKKVIEMGKVEN